MEGGDGTFCRSVMGAGKEEFGLGRGTTAKTLGVRVKELCGDLSRPVGGLASEDGGRSKNGADGPDVWDKKDPRDRVVGNGSIGALEVAKELGISDGMGLDLKSGDKGGGT